MFPLLCIVAWSGAAQPLPPETSTITIPIRTDLKPIAAEIEKRVDAKFAGKTAERGIDIRYDVARDPIHLRMIGAGLHSLTTIHYAMEACRGRFPCVSCGYGESRRMADITLHTALSWDPSWRLRSSTRLLPVNYAKPCEVTWLGIDITRRFVAPVVEDQLGDAAKIIDRNVPALTNIRPQAEQIWTALQTPYELAPRTWLVLDPTDVALSPITGANTTVSTMLSLHATTRVVVGGKPAATRKPLPALKSVAATGPAYVRVPFDLELPYDEASRLATRDYGNRTVQVSGRSLTITSLRIAPAPNNRVLIEALIDYRGGRLRNYKGPIFLEGTPRFDAATQTIVVPDLEYSLDPKRRGLFARIAERAAHDTIRARLRESARFPLAAQIAEVRAELSRALTRPLAPGVELHGRADAIEPQSVSARADVIAVRVVARGVAEITIR
ncbi:MAG TPA: DUF4403 family protein [Thermoanaerobaculia bacterium]|nr:DUF4403 family protein [Thermoanaerobaculia bacterium]